MQEVTLKVFSLKENTFVFDAIEYAGCIRTKSKREADIVVCVMYPDEEALETFKANVRRLLFDEEGKLAISSSAQVVFAYAGHSEKDKHVILEDLYTLASNMISVPSCVIVENPINSGEGQKELEEKLVALVSSIHGTKKDEETRAVVATAIPEPDVLLSQSAPEIDLPPRKKVFIISNRISDANNAKLARLITENKYDVAEAQEEADVIVVAFNMADKSQTPEEFFEAKREAFEHKNKNVIFIVVHDSFVETENAEVLRQAQSTCEKEIAPLLMERLRARENSGQRFYVCKTLLNYVLGELKFAQGLNMAMNPPQARTTVDAAKVTPKQTAVSNLQFFKYPKRLTWCHSRQKRSEYAEKHLRYVEGESKNPSMKQDVLRYVHYMSIRHTIFNVGDVKSKLSKKIEKVLAKSLMYKHDYLNYTTESDTNYKRKGRATIRGQKHDRVALMLKTKLLARYAGTITEEFLNKLIDLASCADKLERGFFRLSAKQQGIQNIIDAVEAAYWNEFERQPSEAPRNVEGLPTEAQEKFDQLYAEISQVNRSSPQLD